MTCNTAKTQLSDTGQYVLLQIALIVLHRFKAPCASLLTVSLQGMYGILFFESLIFPSVNIELVTCQKAPVLTHLYKVQSPRRIVYGGWDVSTFAKATTQMQQSQHNGSDLQWKSMKQRFCLYILMCMYTNVGPLWSYAVVMVETKLSEATSHLERLCWKVSLFLSVRDIFSMGHMLVN